MAEPIQKCANSKIFRISLVCSLFLLNGCDRTISLKKAAQFHQTGVDRYKRSDYHLAIGPFETAFLLRKQFLGPTDRDTIASGQFLLVCLDSNGASEKALKIGSDYLSEIEGLSGKESLQYAQIETFLGNVQSGLKKHTQAVHSLRHAKEIYVKELGETNEDSLTAMHNLNLALSHAGMLDEAVKEETKLLGLKRSSLGDKHRETIKSISNLAFAFSKRGNHERATELHEESLALRKEIFGLNHPETQIAKVNLAVAYSRTGQLEKAVVLCRQGYEFFRGYYPEGHSEIRWSALNLRNLLSDSGQTDESTRLTELYDFD